MFQLIQVLNIPWSIASLIQEYIAGTAWWVWIINAGFFVSGLIDGGLASLMRAIATRTLGQMVKKLSRGAAIKL